MSPSQSTPPADFRGPALAASPESYVYELPAPVRRELARLLLEVARGNDVQTDVQVTLVDASARTATALAAGHGLILLRGVPVAGHDRSTLATLFTMMGRALGRPMPQNLEGETITDIRDTRGRDSFDRRALITVSVVGTRHAPDQQQRAFAGVVLGPQPHPSSPAAFASASWMQHAPLSAGAGPPQQEVWLLGSGFAV